MHEINSIQICGGNPHSGIESSIVIPIIIVS